MNQYVCKMDLRDQDGEVLFHRGGKYFGREPHAGVCGACLALIGDDRRKYDCPLGYASGWGDAFDKVPAPETAQVNDYIVRLMPEGYIWIGSVYVNYCQLQEAVRKLQGG